MAAYPYNTILMLFAVYSFRLAATKTKMLKSISTITVWLELTHQENLSLMWWCSTLKTIVVPCLLVIRRNSSIPFPMIQIHLVSESLPFMYWVEFTPMYEIYHNPFPTMCLFSLVIMVQYKRSIQLNGLVKISIYDQNNGYIVARWYQRWLPSNYIHFATSVRPSIPHPVYAL